MNESSATSPAFTADNYFAVIPEWLLDIATPRGVQVYGFLRRYADKDDATAYPSRATLAKRARCSRDTIDRAIAELVSVGAISVTKRGRGEGGQTSNLYRLHTAPMPGGGRVDAAGGVDTDAAGGGRVDAAQNQSHTEPQSSEPQLAKRDTNGHDQLVWALVAAMGWNRDEITKASWGRLHKAAADLQTVDADPHDVARRAQIYRVNFRSATMTPNAIAANWADLAEPRTPITHADVEKAARKADMAQWVADTAAEEAASEALTP